MNETNETAEELKRARERERVRQWRAANPEKARQSAERWRHANADKRRAAAARWYAENKERAAAYHKAYRRRKIQGQYAKPQSALQKRLQRSAL